MMAGTRIIIEYILVNKMTEKDFCVVCYMKNKYELCFSDFSSRKKCVKFTSFKIRDKKNDETQDKKNTAYIEKTGLEAAE